MENKYYTPNPSEFYIGFEYEAFMLNSNGSYLEESWSKIKADRFDIEVMFSDAFEKDDFSQKYRVRYLCIEDIESLGWEYSVLAKRYFLKSVGLDNDEINSGKGIWLFHTGIIESEIPHRLVIVDCRYALHQIRFDGKIKNKSELRKLMQMLNIE